MKRRQSSDYFISLFFLLNVYKSITQCSYKINGTNAEHAELISALQEFKLSLCKWYIVWTLLYTMTWSLCIVRKFAQHHRVTLLFQMDSRSHFATVFLRPLDFHFDFRRLASHAKISQYSNTWHTKIVIIESKKLFQFYFNVTKPLSVISVLSSDMRHPEFSE